MLVWWSAFFQWHFNKRILYCSFHYYCDYDAQSAVIVIISVIVTESISDASYCYYSVVCPSVCPSVRPSVCRSRSCLVDTYIAAVSSPLYSPGGRLVLGSGLTSLRLMSQNMK